MITDHSYTTGLRLPPLFALTIETQSDHQISMFCRFMPWPRLRTGGGALPADTLYNAWRYTCHPFIMLPFGCCYYSAKALKEQLHTIVQYTLRSFGGSYVCKLMLPCLHQICLVYRLQLQVLNCAKLCNDALLRTDAGVCFHGLPLRLQF